MNFFKRKNISKILTVLVFFVYMSDAISQNFKGRATYASYRKSKMKMDTLKYDKKTINIFKKSFEDFYRKEYVLEFEKSTSLFSEQKKLTVQKTVAFSNDKLYKDLNSKLYTHKTELLGKKFLIKDSIKLKKWFLLNETKKIGKYTCTKAVYNRKINNSLETVTAWFTPEIPISNGPANYDGLPGLILQLDDGTYNYLVKEIVLTNTITNLKAPKGGKVVSQADYDRILKEKQKNGLRRAADLRKGAESSRNN